MRLVGFIVLLYKHPLCIIKVVVCCPPLLLSISMDFKPKPAHTAQPAKRPSAPDHLADLSSGSRRWVFFFLFIKNAPPSPARSRAASAAALDRPHSNGSSAGNRGEGDAFALPLSAAEAEPQHPRRPWCSRQASTTWRRREALEHTGRRAAPRATTGRSRGGSQQTELAISVSLRRRGGHPASVFYPIFALSVLASSKSFWLAAANGGAPYRKLRSSVAHFEI